MDRLSFPRSLRSTLHEVMCYGGNRDLYVDLDRVLVRQLREYFYSTISIIDVPVEEKRPRLVDEFIEPDRFERRLKYCIIRMREAGVPADLQSSLLRRAISYLVDTIARSGSIPRWYEVRELGPKIDDLIVIRLAQCFAPWYYPDHFLRYEILEEHELIFWDADKGAWAPSNLGKYARNLNTFSLLLLLLSIEFSFTRSDKKGRYPTRDLALTLLGRNPEKREYTIRYPLAFTWYGIVEKRDDPDAHSEINGFGYRLLSSAVDRFDAISDLLLLLVESDDLGLKSTNEVQGSSGEFLQGEAESELLSSGERATFREVVRLYNARNYLDALRLFYPLIESVLNSALSRVPNITEGRLGMRSKIETLVYNGIISSGVGSWAEIVTSRNKIVHGNLDAQDGLLPPLYLFVAEFFRVLILELRSREVTVNA